MATISEIWRYPVKSFAGERLDSCPLGENGLHGDRRWALIDSLPNRAGKTLTIREHEGLMTFRAGMRASTIEVVDPSGRSRSLDDGLVQEISGQVGRALSLRDGAGVNFDDSPVLIVNLASVAAFADTAGRPIDHRRFRANVYFEGLPSELEVGWLGQEICAGTARLKVVKRCDRCVIITRDPETTVASPELLRILTESYETCMGMYCQVTQPGRIALGDSIGPC